MMLLVTKYAVTTFIIVLPLLLRKGTHLVWAIVLCTAPTVFCFWLTAVLVKKIRVDLIP